MSGRQFDQLASKTRMATLASVLAEAASGLRLNASTSRPTACPTLRKIRSWTQLRDGKASDMQQVLRSLTVAFVAAALIQLSCPVQAQPVAEPPPKQIALTEKQVLAFIAAQKDIQPILDKIQGPSADELPPPIKAELDAAAKNHGFKDFNDYDEVTNNITMVMTSIDSKTKVFTDPAISIKEEMQEITANKDLPAQERKQMLDDLNEALKSAQPIQFPNNIELVRKHYDKIDQALK